MRTKIWHQMIAARYKAIYLSHFNSFMHRFERLLGMITAVAASGMVGSWVLWRDIPWVWAAIIAIAQLTKALKPRLPFLSDQKLLLEMYVFYQQHHHDWECFWEEMAANKFEEDALRDHYFDLKASVLEEDARTAHLHIPEWRFVVRKAERDFQLYLQTNHQVTKTNE